MGLVTVLNKNLGEIDEQFPRLAVVLRCVDPVSWTGPYSTPKDTAN